MRKNMTLNEIRQINDTKTIIKAIEFLCDNMQKMTYGEFDAMKRTIEFQALNKLGMTIQQINDIAERYQIYGY